MLMCWFGCCFSEMKNEGKPTEKTFSQQQSLYNLFLLVEVSRMMSTKAKLAHRYLHRINILVDGILILVLY